MSTTTETPVAVGTPNLNKALAAVQAAYVTVGKGQTGKVSGVTKDGKPFSYDYDYADLAAVSAAVLPLIGSHGLAFSSRPTLAGGQFVLEYELLHESGESKGGIYPLPGSGKPQEIGSAITYARRYALCAVIGIAPGGKDDDGAAASQREQQFSRARSAGDAFASAVPATEYRRQQDHATETVPLAPAEADPAVVADWGAKIDAITSTEDAEKADAELREVFKGGRMDATTANAIRNAIKTKASAVAGTPAAPSADDTGYATRIAEAATQDDLLKVMADIRSSNKASATAEVDGETLTLHAYVMRRKTELEPEMAGAR